METTSIDGLFQQIISSEQAAQRRKDQLNECKQNVHISQEKVKSLHRECSDLYKRLEQKLSEMTDKELLSKSLRIQENIFEQQKDELKHQIDSLVKKEEEIQANFFEKRTHFCEELERVCSSIGLNGQGLDERTDKFSDELAVLLKEEAELKTGLQQYNDKKKVIDQLTEEKLALQSQLEAAVSENNKVKSTLFDVLEVTEKLEEERISLSDQPHTGHTFLSLQRELDAEKELATQLDEELSHLQAQLQQAHQKLWHKQVQQRQQQQIQLKHRQESMAVQNQTTSDEWDGSDMDLIMEEFTDDDIGSMENLQQSSNTRQPPSRKSIFRSGNKPPRSPEDN